MVVENMKKKPNVLILYSDQHSARTLGCYGNQQVKTPNLDKLAREGVLFNEAFTQNPICTPSRMCLLSGQYVHNFGTYGLMGNSPENLPTMFEHFKKQGYTTGMAGKTHTPAGWASEYCDFVGDGYGFENKTSIWKRANEEGCQGMRGDDYSLYLEELGLLKDRDDKIMQEWFEEYDHTKGQCVDARPSRIPLEHSIEAWSANVTNEFIGNAVEEDKPFCFWLTVPRPHQTYAPSQEFWDLYEGMELELPPNAGNDMTLRSDAAKKTQKNFQEEMDWIAFGDKDFEEARKRVLRGYYACVSQMDDALGRVMKQLETLGILEDTIVVYTTDHGEFAGEHGMIEKAPGIGFGCVTKIPMIMSWKGHLPTGEVRESLVESIDVFPTVCELAEVSAPNWVDGISIVPTVLEDKSLHDIAVTEHANTKTIHTKEYKLTQYLPEFQKEDFGELFDRINDPYELKNLYFEPEYQHVVQELRYKLYCWLVRNTRVYNVNPTCPVTGNEKDVSGGLPWELVPEYGICGDDGKVGRDFFQMMIDKGVRNYL